MSGLAQRQKDVLEWLRTNRGAHTPNDVAYGLGFKPGMAKTASIGTRNTSRVMGPAVHVTPALTGLRRRGLVDFGGRPDGRSGTAYALTAEGRSVAERLAAEYGGKA